MFEQIIGHKNVCTFLAGAIKTGRVAHAYLFLGPAQVGKETVARAFAEALLHGDGIEHRSLLTHPDVTLVSRPTDEKTGEPKAAITIDQIRAFRERLGYSSLFASWKIAFIRDAETLTAEAANALLKTLEEPRGKTVIILIAARARLIPATIRSRTQLVRFSLVRRNELEVALKHRGAGPHDAERLSRIASGRPGSALALLEDPRALEEHLASIRERQEVLRGPVYARIRWTEAEMKGQKAGALTREIALWRGILRDALLRAVGAPELVSFEGGEVRERPPALSGIVRDLDRLEAARAAVRHHVDARLALEYFLLSEREPGLSSFFYSLNLEPST